MMMMAAAAAATTIAANQEQQQKQKHKNELPSKESDRHKRLAGGDNNIDSDTNNNNNSQEHERQTIPDRRLSGHSLQEQNSCASPQASNSNGAWNSQRRSSNSNSSLSAKRFEGTQKLNLILPSSEQTSSLTTPNDLAPTSASNENNQSVNNNKLANQQQQLHSANHQLFIDSLAKQLASSANAQGPDVSLFTGLPSCTPASADRLAATTSVNPFFWGLASSASATIEQPNGSQVASESCLPAPNGGTKQHNESNTFEASSQQQQQQHKQKLSMANMQTSNGLSPMILSPLSILGLSPEQEAWLCFNLSPNQNPLAAAAAAANRQYQNPFLQQQQQSEQQQQLSNLNSQHQQQQQQQQQHQNQHRAQDLTSHQQQANLNAHHLGHQNGVGQPTMNHSTNGFTHTFNTNYYTQQQQQQQHQANQYSHQFQFQQQQQQQQHCHQPSQPHQQQISQMQSASPANTNISQPVIQLSRASNQPIQPQFGQQNINLNYGVRQTGRSYVTAPAIGAQQNFPQPAADTQPFGYAAAQQIQSQAQGLPSHMVLAACNLQHSPASQLVAAHQNNYPNNQHHHSQHQNHQNFHQQASTLANNQQQALPQLNAQHSYQQPNHTLAVGLQSANPSNRLIGADKVQTSQQQGAKKQDQSQLGQSQHKQPTPNQHPHHQSAQTKEILNATSAHSIISPAPSCSSSNGKVAASLEQIYIDSDCQPSTGATSRRTSTNGSPVPSSISRSSSGCGDSAATTPNPAGQMRLTKGRTPLTDSNKQVAQEDGPSESSGDEKKTLYLINGSKHIKSSKRQAGAQPHTTITNENGEIVLVKKKSRGGRKKKLVTHDELIARKNRSKERNRVAAKRCRQKRKQFLDELRDKIDGLHEFNQKLQKENAILKSELQKLKQHHDACRL